jgi:CRP/FNR family cyclic AMP-dependent transcriptional regulator
VDALPVLLRSPLFAGIPEQQLEELLPQVHVRSFPRGEFLFHEGDPAGPLYIVVRGLVSVARDGRGGEESILALLGPDDVIGELALFAEETERSADAQALEPTECLAVPRIAVRELLGAKPAAMIRLAARLAGTVRRKDQALADLAFLDIPGRVAAKLLELAETHGEHTPEGTRIGHKLSQRTLAGMIGASRENVNRALAAFSDQGAIRQENGLITILSPAALRRRS